MMIETSLTWMLRYNPSGLLCLIVILMIIFAVWHYATLSAVFNYFFKCTKLFLNSWLQRAFLVDFNDFFPFMVNNL